MLEDWSEPSLPAGSCRYEVQKLERLCKGRKEGCSMKENSHLASAVFLPVHPALRESAKQESGLSPGVHQGRKGATWEILRVCKWEGRKWLRPFSSQGKASPPPLRVCVWGGYSTGLPTCSAETLFRWWHSVAPFGAVLKEHPHPSPAWGLCASASLPFPLRWHKAPCGGTEEELPGLTCRPLLFGGCSPIRGRPTLK